MHLRGASIERRCVESFRQVALRNEGFPGNNRYRVFFAALALAALPAIVSAIPLGAGELTSVTPKYSARVAGPTGGSVQRRNEPPWVSPRGLVLFAQKK
jgi:hypothetical protein